METLSPPFPRRDANLDGSVPGAHQIHQALCAATLASTRDGGLPFTLIRDVEVYDGDDCAPTPTTTIDHGQTFPETPRAFSPILTADFAIEDVYPSVSNVLSQVREALTESETELDGRRSRTSPVSPNYDEAAAQKALTTEADSEEEAVDDEITEDKFEGSSRRYSRPKSYPSTLNSSPPISPMDLPPFTSIVPNGIIPIFAK